MASGYISAPTLPCSQIWERPGNDAPVHRARAGARYQGGRFNFAKHGNTDDQSFSGKTGVSSDKDRLMGAGERMETPVEFRDPFHRDRGRNAERDETKPRNAAHGGYIAQ